jgi:Arc/MetJ family transcription regulator
MMCYDAEMRTTLTIDDAIAKALKELAHSSNKPFKQVVNETLRAGLGAAATPGRRRYRLKPARLGGVLAGVNLDKALALADAIEDQELGIKMQLRK